MVQKDVANSICMSWGFPKFPYQPRWTIKNFRNEAPGNLGAWATLRESLFRSCCYNLWEVPTCFWWVKETCCFFSRKSPLNDGFLKIVENIYFLVKTLISWYVYKWWNFTKQILGGKRHSTPKRRSFWAAGGRQSIGSGTNLLSPSVDGSEIRRSPVEVGTRWASYQL